MIGTITRRSVLARKARFIIIGLAILLGVAFVSGSFILADSLRNTFDSLFSDITKDVDLEVRSAQAFDAGAQSARDPVPASIVDTVASIEGVETVEPSLSRYAQIVDADGDIITTQGAPTLGVSWSGPNGLSGVTLREGSAPNGAGQVAIDAATADRADFTIGDTVTVITDSGTRQFELVGLIGLGDAKGFAGATLAAFDDATAQEVLDSKGFFDTIDIGVAEGADPAQVQAAVAAALPERTEVITGQQVADEASDSVNQFIGIFGNGLLAFAFVTAFVSAFIINNVFAITIGQRLQELALLRAIGASGRQVRRMVLAEALMISVLATILGIGAGVIVAKGIIALFNAAGAGFPAADIIMAPRTVLAAILVGVGITLVSVLVPARRAARVPPVAAMRPEVGFAALTSGRRKILGTIVTVVGGVLFLLGLFARPGGTAGTIALMAIGVLLLFLGIASLSGAFARPVARLLGWPIDKLLKTPGHLARENAARNPRRTASTASALMIGVALVSVAAVFATSLKATFSDTLEKAVKADYILTDESFQGLPPTLADTLTGLPELGAVSPVRGIQAEVGGDQKALGVVNGASFGELVDLDVTAGSVDDLTVDTVMLHKDPAEDLGVGVGDSIDVTYLNGVTGSLKVVGIYEDASLAGNWLISVDTLEQVSTQPPRDFFVLAKLADGVEPAAGRAAIESVLADFPQTKLQDQAEFRRDQEGQIDQLLSVISVLLVFAILIAVLGIAITLALSVYERTRELGLMRAVGMTRRQTRRMVRWEAVIVSVFGAVLGLVLGTVLGALLATAVPDTVINGVTVPYTLIVVIVLGAIFAGLAAAWWPARKASKMDVLEAIATT
ncbi:MAG: ABC transporter permease [Acidimicrobiia bacterium]